MSYNLQSRTIREELLQDEEVPSFGEEYSDNEENNVSEMSEGSEYQSSSESEDSMDKLENASLEQRLLEASTQARERGRPVSRLKGKNDYVWNVKPQERTSGRFSNPSPERIPGPKDAAANLESIEQFWDILFNGEIINVIVEHTNDKIEDVCALMIDKGEFIPSYYYHTDIQEIKAFIGILYFAGLWKSANVDIEDLWSAKNGTSFYRCVMSIQRFRFLSKCMRFDNKSTRDMSDKFAAIRKIWDLFMANCKRHYEPSNECTVDEQLLGFQGRCSFRMFSKSKPDKYGLKIVTLNDARTAYLIFGIPYLGKSTTPRNESISEMVFKDVTASIHGSGRSVTCGNWFTTIPLIETMLEEEYNLTVTGAIRENKREILGQMKVADNEPPESKFCFSANKNIPLVCFNPRKKKIVLLASSHVLSPSITDNKPDMVLFYNSTKGGTDTFDQLCHAYTTSRRCYRWPIRIFFGMLDQAIVNARILLTCKLKNSGRNAKIPAKLCLDTVSKYLVMPYLRERYFKPNISNILKFSIAGIINEDVKQQLASADQCPRLPKRARCLICKRDADRKTVLQCSSCKRPMCVEHRAYLCVDCAYVDHNISTHSMDTERRHL